MSNTLYIVFNILYSMQKRGILNSVVYVIV